VGDYVKGVGSLSTGKVVRAKSDIPAKLAKSYAESERIPLKQAYQELMVASKREYKMISSFHNGGTISPKKARPVGSGTNGSTPIKTSTSTSSRHSRLLNLRSGIVVQEVRLIRKLLRHYVPS
jgi:hypothetical protein